MPNSVAGLSGASSLSTPSRGTRWGFWTCPTPGELATCLPLSDPGRVLEPLRSTLDPYPTAVHAAFIDNLWQAGFLVDAARKGIPKLDVGYVDLCCSTALMLCAHAWHASAGSWVTNEKGVIVDVERLPVDSNEFASRAAAALSRLGNDPEQLESMVGAVDAIVTDTKSALQSG